MRRESVEGRLVAKPAGASTVREWERRDGSMMDAVV